MWAAITVAIVLGIGLAIFGSVDRFPEFSSDFQPSWLILGVLGFFVLIATAAELWRRILLALGSEIGPRPALTIWAASALGRYVPTSLLLPVMRMAMSERQGVPKRICLASLAYELVFGLTGALLVGAYFVVDLPDLQGDPARFLVLALPAVALLVLYPRTFDRLSGAVLSRLGRPRLARVLSERHVLAFVLAYTAQYAASGVAVFALAHSVYPVDAGDLPVIAGGFAAGAAVSLVAFIIPSGLLAREAAFVVAVSSVLPTAPAVAVAVMIRIVQIAAEVVLTAVGPLIGRLRGGLGRARIEKTS
jgi:hypothetical protein